MIIEAYMVLHRYSPDSLERVAGRTEQYVVFCAFTIQLQQIARENAELVKYIL